MRRLTFLNNLINLGTISINGEGNGIYHQNIQKDTVNLLVNLVSRGTFEDILTSLIPQGSECIYENKKKHSLSIVLYL